MAEHILVVEDDPLVRSLLKAKFQAEGYQVTAAATVGEALRAVRLRMPELIVLDLTVLDVDPFSGLTDGFAFLTMLQRNYPEARIPVIIHSVDNSPAVQARAKSMGVGAVIKKGAPVDQLLQAVRQALDAGKAHSEAPKAC